MTSWAVVTGASGGLGEAFARHLARQGSNVALVARSAEAMQAVAEDLERSNGVATRVLPVDLTDRAARSDLIAELSAMPVHTLVNNAGFGTHGAFTTLGRDRLTREIELNAVALTDLTHALLPGMVDRDRGAIINVASTAAFQPIPEMATYAATKAYVLSFSNALWGELRGTGVRVVCICPGPTDTGFFEAIGNDAVMTNRRTPEQVITATFQALGRRQPYVVDGLLNKTLAQANRFAPTALALRISNWIATR